MWEVDTGEEREEMERERSERDFERLVGGDWDDYLSVPCARIVQRVWSVQFEVQRIPACLLSALAVGKRQNKRTLSPH